MGAGSLAAKKTAELENGWARSELVAGEGSMPHPIRLAGKCGEQISKLGDRDISGVPVRADRVTIEL